MTSHLFKQQNISLYISISQPTQKSLFHNKPSSELSYRLSSRKKFINSQHNMLRYKYSSTTRVQFISICTSLKTCTCAHPVRGHPQKNTCFTIPTLCPLLSTCDSPCGRPHLAFDTAYLTTHSYQVDTQQLMPTLHSSSVL